MPHVKCFNRRAWLILWMAVFTIQIFQLLPTAHAQDLGSTPALNKTVQGQEATQPEGTLLNLVNFVGNVLCPLSAAVFVVAAVVSYVQGRGAARWAITAIALLM